MLQDVPCKAVDCDDYSLKLKLEQDLPEGGQHRLSQDKITADPQQLLQQLATFWMPSGTMSIKIQKVPQFQRFLDALPQVIPGVAQTDSLYRWNQAVATLKTPSARGADAMLRN